MRRLETLKLWSVTNQAAVTSARVRSRTKFSSSSQGALSITTRLGDVQPTQNKRKGSDPDAETLRHRIEQCGVLIVLHEWWHNATGRDVWRIDRCEAVLPDPIKQRRARIDKCQRSKLRLGLSRFNNKELNVHRHDDPLRPLSRHVWVAQPVFYIVFVCSFIVVCLILRNSAGCTCCARPETLYPPAELLV